MTCSRGMRGVGILYLALLLGMLCSALADTHYVNVNSPAPWHPYTSWDTAATDIQTAVDTAESGDTVLVTNGTYTLSGQISMTNALTIRSVNGADSTIVRGSGAARCFRLSHSNAVVDGLTIKEGAESYECGGGVYIDQYGTVKNCTIINNAALRTMYPPGNGGGVYCYLGGEVLNCRISGNSASRGGGVYCVGGGTVRNSIIRANTAHYAGGVGISATGTIENCTVVANSATYNNGASGVQCWDGGTVLNTIIYLNTGEVDRNWSTNSGGGTFAYSCTTPDPGGTGNTTNNPQFADSAGSDYHVLPGSTCIDGGTNLEWMTGATDMDGRPRLLGGTPDMGAYELDPDPLSCNLIAAIGEGTAPLEVMFTAHITGTNTTGLYYWWDFDNDGTNEMEGSECVVATNVYTEGGYYSVSLTVSNAVGEVASRVRQNYIAVGHAVVYVSPSGSHTWPYTNWATAANDIQTAVNEGKCGTLVLVTNGTYYLVSRIDIAENVTVRSVNGPGVTAVDGNRMVGCFVLRDPGATLDGLTIQNGSNTWSDGWSGSGVYCDYYGTVQNCVLSNNCTRSYGGAAYLNRGGVLRNCRIIGNEAADRAGGVYCYFGGTVRNCLITGNVATNTGGGIYVSSDGVVENCTIVGNRAPYWGGISCGSGIVRNSIIYNNTATISGDNAGGAAYSYCCTVPDPGGTGNTISDPELLDPNSDDFRIGVGSPCVNTGTNDTWMTTATDLAGEPRIYDEIVDIGCYEFDPDLFSCNFTISPKGATTPAEIVFTAMVSGTNTSGLYYWWDFDDDGTWDLEGMDLAVVSNIYEHCGAHSASLAVSNSSGEYVTSVKKDYIDVYPAVTYVSGAGTHTPPYTNWAMAANDIQSGIDIGGCGTVVLVATGTYDITSEIVVANDVTVQSLSGSSNTMINGNGLTRCIRVRHTNAVVDGFTIAGGIASNGPGVYFERDGMVRNCTIAGNLSTGEGGAVYFQGLGTLEGSLLTGNTGGVSAAYLSFGGAVSRCIIRGNNGGTAVFLIGGGFVQNSLVMENSGDAINMGWWIGPQSIYNCTIVSNFGVGVSRVAVYNSIVYFNSKNYRTGGDMPSFYYTCASPNPGGEGNTGDLPEFVDAAERNYHLSPSSPCIDSGTNLSWLATAEDLEGRQRIINSTMDMGAYEFEDGPLTSDFSVDVRRGFSPVTVVLTSYVRGTNMTGLTYHWDLDGDGTIDLSGANRGVVTNIYTEVGSYSVSLLVSNLAGESSQKIRDSYIEVDQSVFLSANNRGGMQPFEAVLVCSNLWTNAVPTYYWWDFDNDGTPDLEGPGLDIVTNLYLDAGHKTVSLTVSNSSGGVSWVTRTDYIYVAPTTNYVSLAGSHEPPFVSWSTAATNVQDAVNAATNGTLILVGPGTYRLEQTLHVENGSIVRSVAGPSETILDGGNAMRCVEMMYAYGGENVLDGFTITGGSFPDAAGMCLGHGIIENCVITGNVATNGGGGGALHGRGLMRNCIVSNNVAGGPGGGVVFAEGGVMRNCLVVKNQAIAGGGAFMYIGGTIENCTIVDNAATNYGGGIRLWVGGHIVNTIVYYNTAPWRPDTANDPDGKFYHYSCAGGGNSTTGIPGPPGFVDWMSGDYRLSTTSTCVDTGINSEWMQDATDLDGNPRILSGKCDVGAFELALKLKARMLLGGAYETGPSLMRTNLLAGLSTDSQYAADQRTADAIPSNAVDWVLVELREDTNSAAAFSKSAFVLRDGSIVSARTGGDVILESPAGSSRYLVVKHRNHLSAMSSARLALTNALTSYDFTSGPGRYYGGASGAVELEPGIWGMVAGDADGDGEILAIDTSISQTQNGMSGYRRGDFNMDGVVSIADWVILWSANQGRISAVPNPAVGLSPALSVIPSRKTILPGDSITFGAQGSTGTVTWGFVKNLSGANFSPATKMYQAGITPSCIDILEAWDVDNLLGRAYVNVIDPADVALAGKAIIIAGRRSEDDPLWPATDYMADQAYNTLLYRGFSKANIQYLSPETQQDVDGNGVSDDVDLESLLANAQTTFQTWAANSDKLFVYLVDHGGDSSGNAYFRLNSTEVITAAQLDSWLDDLQDVYGTEIILVIDCCYSGSFVDELAYVGPPKRIVITGCGNDEATYFVAGGLVSFSDAFLSGILLGLDVAASYAQARDAMATYQSAWLDDNGDGAYEEGVDGQYASGVYVGATFVEGKDIPQIGMVCGNQLLSGSSEAILWADDIASAYPINRAWCLIIPPDHNPDPDDPVADIVELDLLHSEITGRYEANYQGFCDEGTYKVIYYARDTWGSVSMPRQSYVMQVGFDERVILVSGGETNDAGWAIVNNMANLAYHTFRQRWLDTNSIYYLNASMNQDLDSDGANDVDSLPTLAALQSAITSWGAAADKLTICLVGESTNGGFRMNGTETLLPAQLSAWLDSFQGQTEAPVYVVMEFPGSGSFLGELTPTAGVERICVASTEAGGDSCWGSEGMVSFWSCFLSGIFRGETIGESFFSARTFIRLVTRNKQKAQLDDNGDGVFDSKEDGDLAWQRYIGTAFMTGADVPEIGSVTPDALAMDSSGTTLWAAEVTDMDGISNVWCVITPPDYSASGDLVETNLAWHAGNQRYEGIYTNLSPLDQYVFTFYARDNLGEISVPVQSLRMGCGRVEGVVRNAFTGERIEGANMGFNGTNGLVEGQTYDGYPNNSTQKVYWLSLGNGAFPTNIWLPTVDWDLAVSRTGYSSLFMDMCVTGLNAGSVVDLGTVRMLPVDTNANAIADNWENTHFPGETVDPVKDSDGDGHNNRSEYVSGTDPRNDMSVFKIDHLEPGSDMTLTWLASPGRTYQVEATNALPWSILTGWPVVAGPFEATNGQALMQWIDETDIGERELRFYRVKVVVP